MEGAEGELIELFVTEWPQSIDYCCSKAERSGMRARVRQPSRLQNSALCVKLKFVKKRAGADFFSANLEQSKHLGMLLSQMENV